MTYPTVYIPSFSFTGYQTANPSTPLPGNQVDNELYNLSISIAQIVGSLELIQRSDGALANLSVGNDQLQTEVDLGFNSITDWATGTAYVERDYVNVASLHNSIYRCIIAHTSTVFINDLNAGDWELVVDFNTPVGAATTSAAAALVSQTAAAASATSAASSQSAASTSATAAASSATSAAASANTIGSGFVNVLRNTTHLVNQRGTSGSVTAGNVNYTSDGWMVGATGATVAWAIGAGAGVSANLGNYLNLTGATSLTDVLVKQRIEGSVAAKLTNQQVTFQVAIANNTAGIFAPKLTVKYANSLDNWGSSTSIVSAVSLQSAVLSTWQILSYTFSAGANAANGLEITVDMGSALNSSSNVVAVGAWDLRATPGASTGLQASPPVAEIRPVSVEFPMNQRYYQTVVSAAGIVMQNYCASSGSFSIGEVFLRQTMRVTPSIAFLTGSVGFTNCSTPAAGQISPDMFSLGLTTAGTGNYSVTQLGYTASAEL